MTTNLHSDLRIFAFADEASPDMPGMSDIGQLCFADSNAAFDAACTAFRECP